MMTLFKLMALFKLMIVPTTIAVIFAGCHDSGKTGEESQLDTTAPGRASLIAQLKWIQRLLASGDKQMISQLFSYPLPDSVGHIYSEDTTFYPELQKNGGYMTREMFIRHFDGISEVLQFEEYNRLFEFLHVDSLLHRDTLEAEDDTANAPCIYFYRIEVEGDTLVRITYGVSAVNPNYSASAEKAGGGENGSARDRDTAAKARNNAAKDQDSATKDRDSTARAVEDSTAHDDLYNEGDCEHDIFWVYRFDGHRLHLLRHDAAD